MVIKNMMHGMYDILTAQEVCPRFSSKPFGQPDLLEQIVTVDDNLGISVKLTNVGPNFS
jgi:hypothetical protein